MLKTTNLLLLGTVLIVSLHHTSTYRTGDVRAQQRCPFQNPDGGFDVDQLQQQNTQIPRRRNKPIRSENRRDKRQTQCQWLTKPDCTGASIAYRTADGSCNNLITTDWGMAGTPQRRLVTDPTMIGYDDGISTPRVSAALPGTSLPWARNVSVRVHGDDTRNDFSQRGMANMVMQWGQFLTHDLVSTPQYNNTGECCWDELNNADKSSTSQTDLDSRDNCFAIPVIRGDRYFTSRTCLGFVRSIRVQAHDCQSPQKEQLNVLTSWLDASNVYGSTHAYMDGLRSKTGGKLIMDSLNMLPHESTGADCYTDNDSDICFKAGDVRVNTWPGLMSMHIIWAREHNRIAEQLAGLNSHWDDERLFQESRKIVGAMMQHITYKEYLPVILGNQVGDLLPSNVGQVSWYNPSVDPRIAVEFATAAFRFGHSTIQSSFTREYGAINETTDLDLMYGKTKYMLENNGDGLDAIVTGLLRDQAEKADDWYSTMITDHLFEQSPQESMDLAAMNLQRGRDHGIPSYNNMRRWCGLSPSAEFQESQAGFVDTRSSLAVKFSRVYVDPEDLDFYSGGVGERSTRHGVVGNVFSCVIRNQFQALRAGDRFWYEDPNTFTEAQTNAIKTVSLNKIICQNTKVTHIGSRSTFILMDPASNPEVECSALPDINLSAWAE